MVTPHMLAIEYIPGRVLNRVPKEEVSPTFLEECEEIIRSIHALSLIHIWQLWGFIAPGLYRKEKKLAAPIIISSLVMFFLGMAYCYFIVFRMVFQFIAGFSPNSVNFAPDIDSYFSFVLALFLAFGLTFEVPIIVVVLNRMGITSISKLKKARPYMVVGAFVLAAIVTPPDVLSQCLLALPLVILYQVGIWLCAVFGKKDEPEEESAESS